MEFLLEWNEVFWKGKEAMHEDWPIIFLWLLFLGIPALTGFAFGRYERKKHRNIGVINLSHNRLEKRPTGPDQAGEVWLELHTWGEGSTKAVVAHEEAVKLIKRAAKKTTRDQPFLEFEGDDRWHVMSIVHNAIASKFALGAARMETKAATFEPVDWVFALTYERYDGSWHRKVRAIIIKKETLLGPLLDDKVRVEYESLSSRIGTLRMMQEHYRKNGGNGVCMDVHVKVPT